MEPGLEEKEMKMLKKLIKKAEEDGIDAELLHGWSAHITGKTPEGLSTGFYQAPGPGQLQFQ